MSRTLSWFLIAAVCVAGLIPVVGALGVAPVNRIVDFEAAAAELHQAISTGGTVATAAVMRGTGEGLTVAVERGRSASFILRPASPRQPKVSVSTATSPRCRSAARKKCAPSPRRSTACATASAGWSTTAPAC